MYVYTVDIISSRGILNICDDPSVCELSSGVIRHWSLVSNANVVSFIIAANVDVVLPAMFNYSLKHIHIVHTRMLYGQMHIGFDLTGWLKERCLQFTT